MLNVAGLLARAYLRLRGEQDPLEVQGHLERPCPVARRESQRARKERA